MRNLLIAGILTSFVVACDNPVKPEEHPEAGGVVILQAGTNNVLSISTGATTNFTLPLQMQAGGALEVEILFLDASAPSDITKAFHPHEDEGESLRVVIANENVVEYHGHGDHGDFEAVAAGQTTAYFELMHGSHADFRSGTLTIIVN